MRSINRDKLAHLLDVELRDFRATHPRSAALHARAARSLQAGVPMLWMVRWPGAHPIYVEHARGAHLVDVDGIEYIDFCLGDTGAMTGHAPSATLDAVRRQFERGITTMLPNEDSIWVAEELCRRFGLPYWQLALSATDANRFALRMARLLTKREKILVFNYSYHGSVDETLIALDEEGTAFARPGNLGPPIDPRVTTKVIEFNDIAALETALSARDVAAVLAEPVMTNIGIIHPLDGFHDALRELTRKYGTFLILDETHTICAGAGGYTSLAGLEPDFVTMGKPLAGGLPAAAYGFTEAISRDFANAFSANDADVGGIGGTLAGNALSIAAMRATLEHVLTPQFYTKATEMQERFSAGVEAVIAEFELPWIVKRLGARCEYWFRATAPKNGGEAQAAIDADLDRFMHLFALNRGILLTPFHNMALMCDSTSEHDVGVHTEVFRQAVAALI